MFRPPWGTIPSFRPIGHPPLHEKNGSDEISDGNQSGSDTYKNGSDTSAIRPLLAVHAGSTSSIESKGWATVLSVCMWAKVAICLQHSLQQHHTQLYRPSTNIESFNNFKTFPFLGAKYWIDKTIPGHENLKRTLWCSKNCGPVKITINLVLGAHFSPQGSAQGPFCVYLNTVYCFTIAPSPFMKTSAVKMLGA